MAQSTERWASNPSVASSKPMLMKKKFTFEIKSIANTNLFTVQKKKKNNNFN